MAPDPSPLEDNIMATLARELTHEYTRVRRSAIEHAEEMLKAGQYPYQVMVLLKNVTFADSSLSVRDKAQEVLNRYKEIYPEDEKPEQALPTIDVHCTLGHVSTFNKRDICSNLGRYWRRSILRDGIPYQELVLTCQTCGEHIVIDLDCAGFE